MQALVWILRFVIVVILVWFAVKNSQEVILNGLPDQQLKAPLVFVLLVVFVVWYSCFWLARKLKVDDEFAAMLSTAVSICGVSAAIAACGAIKGDKKKLSYVTSLVLIVAVPMMIAMPWIAKSTGMNDLVAGHVQSGFTTMATASSVLDRVRTLAVASATRLAAEPNIATAAAMLARITPTSRAL